MGIDNRSKNTLFFYILLSLLALSSFVTSSRHTVRLLDLNEGDICQENEGIHSDYVCKRAENCGSIRTMSLDLCSYDGLLQPIYCCPQNVGKPVQIGNRFAAIEKRNVVHSKCFEYTELAKKYQSSKTNANGSAPPELFTPTRKDNKVFWANCEKDLESSSKNKSVVDKHTTNINIIGFNNLPKEFPHMVMFGYGETAEEKKWMGCAGSLISEKWILTTATCKQINSLGIARWARLGYLTDGSRADDGRSRDYQIAEHVLHQCYRPSSAYNNIALFRLETDVRFSEYIRPICLNSDPSLEPYMQVATSWGKTSFAEPYSDDLLSIALNIVPENQCNISYFKESIQRGLKYGIIDDRIICANPSKRVHSTFGVSAKSLLLRRLEHPIFYGDSGGPLQVKFVKSKLYTQFGITSFGTVDHGTLVGYTRVSKYIPWIESVVWPNFLHKSLVSNNKTNGRLNNIVNIKCREYSDMVTTPRKKRSETIPHGYVSESTFINTYDNSSYSWSSVNINGQQFHSSNQTNFTSKTVVNIRNGLPVPNNGVPVPNNGVPVQNNGLPLPNNAVVFLNKGNIQVSRGSCETDLESSLRQINTNEKYTTDTISIEYRTLARPKEYPHMALFGYGEMMETIKWGACTGSLISERWILTTAKCKKINNFETARFVRLGDLNVISTADDARPKVYRIVDHIIHPCYRPPSVYNDIALFRLETDVEFFEYVTPICLNSDPFLEIYTQVSTSWGKTSLDGQLSADLLSIPSNIVPGNQCNISYFSDSIPYGLNYGILDDRIICAIPVRGIDGTYGGDSGGSLQVKLSKSTLYTQFGITSFGKMDRHDTPVGYTRVSKYIPWIESIVWPTLKVSNFRTFGETANIADMKCGEYSEIVKTKNKRQQIQTPSTAPGLAAESTLVNKKYNTFSSGCAIDLENSFQNSDTKEKNSNSNEVFIIDNSIVAKPKKYPHMALIGYGKSAEEQKWMGCAGSLISERWILTSATCKQINSMEIARWARLGDLNIASNIDDARPRDYRIVEHVLHPCYEPPSVYNDIALFRLETDVEFSEYVRPICLNADPTFEPYIQVATSWGKTSFTGSLSDDLLSIHSTIVPASQCNSSYFTDSIPRGLKYGILDDRIICGSPIEGINGTFGGDSGGPLQAENSKSNIYTQFGITSFSKLGHGSPVGYTRVSKYISWIEDVVWPQ